MVLYKNIVIITFFTCFLQASDFVFMTDVHKACVEKDVRVLKKILHNDTHALAIRDVHGKTPLDLSIESDDFLPVVKVLLQYGASSVAQVSDKPCSLDLISTVKLMNYVIKHDKTLCHESFYSALCNHVEVCKKIDTQLFKCRHFIHAHDIVLFFLLHNPKEHELLEKKLKKLSNLDPFAQSSLFGGVCCFDQVVIYPFDTVFNKYITYVYTQWMPPLYKEIYCGKEFIAGVCYDILACSYLSDVQKAQRIIFILTIDDSILTDDVAYTIFSVLCNFPQEKIFALYIDLLIKKQKIQKCGIPFVHILLQHALYDLADIFLDNVIIFDPHALKHAILSDNKQAKIRLIAHFTKHNFIQKYAEWFVKFDIYKKMVQHFLLHKGIHKHYKSMIRTLFSQYPLLKDTEKVFDILLEIIKTRKKQFVIEYLEVLHEFSLDCVFNVNDIRLSPDDKKFFLDILAQIKEVYVQYD